jgi:hypothetical protein
MKDASSLAVLFERAEELQLAGVEGVLKIHEKTGGETDATRRGRGERNPADRRPIGWTLTR